MHDYFAVSTGSPVAYSGACWLHGRGCDYKDMIQRPAEQRAATNALLAPHDALAGNCTRNSACVRANLRATQGQER